jgi:dihydropteroate synthase
MKRKEGRASKSVEFEWGERTWVMGILNVTPDSFSGDGIDSRPRVALDRALRLEEDGADIIDIGGESTRPGAASITEDEELRRVMPALELIVSRVHVPLSIDTYKSGVARRAAEVGVSIINDVWGLKRDIGVADVAAEFGCLLVLMHNQSGTVYNELIHDVSESLSWSVNSALRAGVQERHIIVDPGIGFGKTVEHNLKVLNQLRSFRGLGRPILVGTSRKSTIGLVLGGAPIEERLEGTAASVAIAIANGADVVRVHDVREILRVCRMSDAIVRGWSRLSL